MKLSVGIPTFARPIELVQAIKVLLETENVDFEIIICDNGGSWSQELDDIISSTNSIRYIKNDDNIGVINNTLKCLELATGDYFAWLSDDDWRSNRYFTECLKIIQNYDDENIFVCSNILEITSEMTKSRPYRQKLSKFWKFFEHDNPFIRTLSYLIIPQMLGKCNLMYSVFKLSDLRNLDLSKISGNGENIAFDNFLIYKLLANCKLVLLEGDHICLTEDNIKHYKAGKTPSFPAKVFSYFKNLTKYVSLSEGFLHTLLILIILPLRVLADILFIIQNKIRLIKSYSDINWISYKLIQKRDIILNLDDVFLVCVATKNVTASTDALNYSKRNITFANTLLLAHYKPHNIGSNSFIRIDPFQSVEEWGKFILYELKEHTKFAKHIVLIHDDGFIVNPRSWSHEFLNFDYIGAPWPVPSDKISYRTRTGRLIRVGNSVSLRSQAILNLPTSLNLPDIKFHGHFHEDGFLCVQYREILEENGMAFADYQTASKFGREKEQKSETEPFTFHKWHSKNKKFPNFNKC